MVGLEKVKCKTKYAFLKCGYLRVMRDKITISKMVTLT